MQALLKFGDVLSDTCKQITEKIKLHKDPYTILDIGSGYHPYMFDISKKCGQKVGKQQFKYNYMW